MSLSIGANVNPLTARDKVPASRDFGTAAAQRPPADQDQTRVRERDEKERDAIAVTTPRSTTPSDAEGRIQNAFFAAAAANRVKAQMSEQPALAVMAQANASPQAILALLRA